MLISKSKNLATAQGTLEFVVTQLPAMRSGKVLMRIGKGLGPAIAGLITAVDSKGGDFKSADSLASAARDLFTALDGDELERITRDLLDTAQVKINGEIVPVMPQFDMLFTGHVGSWFSLLWFAFEVNFGSFIGALGGIVRPHMTATKAVG